VRGKRQQAGEADVTGLPVEAVRAPLCPDHVIAAGAAALAVMLGVLARGGLSSWSAVGAATAALLVWIATIDLETRLIPNRIVLPASGILLCATAVLPGPDLLQHAGAALAAGGFLFVAAALRPGDLGMGDAKLALLLGALLGSDVLRALAIGFGLVAVAAAVLVARHGRAGLKRHLPLGPFLAAGAIVTLLLGASS
jgi:leader peptidase (prepilin peptidase) / N-methyltransferase